MRVDVSGAILNIPDECACCGAPPNTDLSISKTRSWGKRVIHTECKEWKMPYCTRCLEHGRRSDEASAFARMSTVVSLGLASLGWYLASWYWALIVGAGPIAITVLVYGQFLQRSRAYSNAGCVGLGWAVSYIEWSGTLHSFDVGSDRFARDLMAANQNKLVNLSPRASRLLSAARHIPPPSSRRSARKCAN